MPKSKCCKAPVTVLGKQKSGCTNWYECNKCERPCDVTTKPKKKVREWTAWMVVFGNKMYRVCISKGNANQWAKAWRSVGAKVIKVKITEVGGRRKGR